MTTTATTEPKRARAEAAQWLLPPVVLHVVRCLETTKDVLAFLDAVPSDACNEPLHALVTLLTDKPGMWPDLQMDDLSDYYVSTAIQALPVLRTVHVTVNSSTKELCRRLPLPPTVDAYVVVYGAHDIRSLGGSWLTNTVDLTICDVELDALVLQQDLGACKRLKTLNIEWGSKISQSDLDEVMAVIAASCPDVSALDLSACTISDLESCESLLKWLGRPIVKGFELRGISFPKIQADALVQALCSSPSLESIKLLSDASFGRSTIFHLSAPWRTPRLRHLVVDTGNITWEEATCRAFPPTLQTFEVYNTRMTDFPQLPELQDLTLCNVELMSNAAKGLCALLAATTTLATVDLSFTRPNFYPHNVDAVMDALPRWLNRQRHKCNVFLDETNAFEAHVAAVIAQTRNTHEISIHLTADLELVARKCLVAVLGATSRMRLAFSYQYDDDEAKPHATMHNVGFDGGYFVSPPPTQA